MMKRSGPKTDPWDTPSETPEHPLMVPYYLHKVLAVSEVRCKPAECSTSNPNASQAVQE